MKFVNLTPHEVVLFDGEEVAVRFPPDGRFARVASTAASVDQVEVDENKIDIAHLVTGEVTDLGPPRPGVIYIVSRVTAAALPERHDLVFPDDDVRDHANQLIGCRRFGRFSRPPDTSAPSKE